MSTCTYPSGQFGGGLEGGWSTTSRKYPRGLDLNQLSLYANQPQQPQALSPDISTDSSMSPPFPDSPIFSADQYQLPASDDWLFWEDKVGPMAPEARPYPDSFKHEADSPLLGAIPEGPSVNPLELSTMMPEMAGASSYDAVVPTSASPVNDGRASRKSSARIASAAASSSKGKAPAPEPSSSSRKRKSSHSTTSSAPTPPAPRGKSSSSRKASQPQASNGPATKNKAHNMIEKRYRNNLNDKIAALRDAVPALRVMVNRLEKQQRREQAGSDEEMADEPDRGGAMDEDPEYMAQDDDQDLGGLTPAHKLNKATVLSKATEYITYLERKNEGLKKENDRLRARVDGMEMLVLSRGVAGSSALGDGWV